VPREPPQPIRPPPLGCHVLFDGTWQDALRRDLSPRDALGRWLDGLGPWEAWCTFTFRTPVKCNAHKRNIWEQPRSAQQELGMHRRSPQHDRRCPAGREDRSRCGCRSGWPGAGPSPDRAAHHFGTWLTQLGRARPGTCFSAVEQGGGGRVHLHALLGGEGGTINRRALWRSWFQRFGICQLLPFVEAKGATHYITKYLTKSPEHWQIH